MSHCDVCGAPAYFEIEAQWTIVDFVTVGACLEHGPNVAGRLCLTDVDGIPCPGIQIKRPATRPRDPGTVVAAESFGDYAF